MMASTVHLEPKLDKQRHIRYWTRCLKTLLPHHYTPNESNRMYLAFFIISALDLLDAWESVATKDEQRDYINWIYHCQHPDGGFRMWPGTDLGEHRTAANAKWDPANIPATYFALSSLVIIGDDLSRVNRRGALSWLRRMQREEGSFGETIVDGTINGGKDPRFGYCAAGIRYILRGHAVGYLTIDGHVVEDIDLDAMVGCIRRSESYDGGIADEPFHEPHAGYEYCALGALHLIGRLQRPEDKKDDILRAPSDPSATIRWLVERQTDLEEEEDDEEDDVLSATSSIERIPQPSDPIETPIPDSIGNPSSDPPVQPPNNIDTQEEPLHQSPDKSTLLPPLAPQVTPLSLTCPSLQPLSAGMNGRTNKLTDTCYAWWAGASFHILSHPELYNHPALSNYLLAKTQHDALGGFGKFPGDLPDLYHSYLGLAALGLMEGMGVKGVCPLMCISREARGRLEGIWRKWDDEK